MHAIMRRLFPPLFPLALCLALYLVGPAQAQEAELIIPLQDAKAGEWIMYDLGSGMQTKETILQVENNMALIRSELFYEGHLTNTTVETLPLDSNVYVDTKLLEQGKIHITNEELPLGGNHIEAQVLEVKGDDGYTLTYISNTVPVHGMLMIMLNQAILIQAVDWGVNPEE